jgi:hypothetical protein
MIVSHWLKAVLPALHIMENLEETEIPSASTRALSPNPIGILIVFIKKANPERNPGR